MPSPGIDELLEHQGILVQSESVARGFAKRHGKGLDGAFIDECKAEAAFVVTYSVMTEYEAITEKYPDKTERLKFYRQMVGYHLLTFYQPFAPSTINYLKKRGIEVKYHELHDSMLLDYTNVFEMQVCLEAICTDAHDERILELYSMGNTHAMIAVKLGMSEKRVKKTLKLLERKLCNYASA